MFSQSTLDRIHDRSILEVADRLLIRYRGTTGNYRRCSCFMHDDRHPSMWFKLSNNTWHCAVCGKGGDSIRLVMEHENLKFDEAVRWIVREFGIFCLYDDDWSQRQWQTRNRKSYSQTISKPIRPPFRMSNSTSSSPTPSHLPTTTPSHLQDLTDLCLSTSSTFCRALLSNGILSEAQMHNAARNYRLGATREGGVIFWMIDTDERVREGKVMFYQTDCHRDHNRSPTTISSILTGKAPSSGLPLVDSHRSMSRSSPHSWVVGSSSSPTLIPTERHSHIGAPLPKRHRESLDSPSRSATSLSDRHRPNRSSARSTLPTFCWKDKIFNPLTLFQNELYPQA